MRTIVLSAVLFGAATAFAQSLHEQFLSPPLETRPGAFWPWLNGNTDRDRLVYDLQQMKEKGMSGAEIWDVEALRKDQDIPAGPEFLSPESVDTIRFALSEAKKLRLRMGMIASSGWNAGGSWVTPDWASKMLVYSSTQTTGPLTLNELLLFPEIPKEAPRNPDGSPSFFREVVVLAVPVHANNEVPNPSEVIDLSKMMDSSGRLIWDVPPGSWDVLRFVCVNTGQSLIVPSPKSNGLFIDFLDPAATRRHLQTILDKLGITRENAKDIGLKYLEVDSMELHKGNPWTNKLNDWFQKDHGYDIQPWLPVLAGYTIGGKSDSDAFLYDYHKTISALLIHSHYETGQLFLQEFGIDFVAESGGPGPPIWDTCPVDALKALGNVTTPRGEFWIEHRNMFLIKEVASAAHIYGKSVVDAESWTTWRRWQDAPFALKRLADRAFCEGMNQITIHTFAHSPDEAGLPGRAYHAGVDINPSVTWWPYARPFMDYMARCSLMLRQGLPVSDVLWYYGDQAPNFFPKFHDVPEIPRLPGLGHGYDYDVVNSDVILNRLEMKDGRYVLPEGTSYKVMAFPATSEVPLEVLQKFKGFVEAGGVLMGDPPKRDPTLRDRLDRQEKLNDISTYLWGDGTPSTRSVGRGRVYSGKTLDEVLAAEKIGPDVTFTPGENHGSITWIHRRNDDQDIYFLANSDTKPFHGRAHFRTGGKTPRLWDPLTGDVHEPSQWKEENGGTLMDLVLPSGTSIFVVFSENPEPAKSLPANPEAGTRIPVIGPWKLTFEENRGAPPSVELAKLRSWPDFDDPGIKFYSGTGTYSTTVMLPVDFSTATTQIVLQLGEIYDVAEVVVNGGCVGTLWAPPYRLDLTGLIHPGENHLEVRVANLWFNRLVGDARHPEKARITKTNVTLPPKNAELQQAGLLGPVTLQIIETK